MSDKEYFSHLYEIASHLNQEFSLPAALRKALEKTAQLLKLDTGWIWLVQGDARSVYLAASYNLPPALSEYPERLSGPCYCIAKYLSNNINQAVNISEVACTRLKDLTAGTRDLKFHATVPIITSGQKVGLLNLVSRESQKLNENQLSILNTIAELIGMVVQRTRLQESYAAKSSEKDTLEMLDRVLHQRTKDLITTLELAGGYAEKKDLPKTQQSIRVSLDQAKALHDQLSLILEETTAKSLVKNEDDVLHYPDSPLTTRELEVLALVRAGHTNKQIGEQLYISERTIKFHLTSIFSKLHASTRTEAVNTAIQRGLL